MAFEDLRNKVVLVTGASRGGLGGRAIALEFSKYGAKVAANYYSSPDKAMELKSMGNIEIFKADVSRRDEVRKMVAQVEETLGKIDILVNNAGIWYLRRFEEFNEEEFNKMWRINFMGMMYTTLEVLPPHMKEKRRGSIINIASNAGIGTAAQGTTFYAITKAAAIILTKRLAFELGPIGIRVNAIAPGWIETDLTIGGKTPDEVSRLEDIFKSKTMLGLVGRPDDVAKLAVYLGSDDSRYMTGQVIVIDGGRMDNLTHGI